MRDLTLPDWVRVPMAAEPLGGAAAASSGVGGHEAEGRQCRRAGGQCSDHHDRHRFEVTCLGEVAGVDGVDAYLGDEVADLLLAGSEPQYGIWSRLPP